MSLGAEGIDADRVAHAVMAPGGAAFGHRGRVRRRDPGAGWRRSTGCSWAPCFRRSRGVGPAGGDRASGRGRGHRARVAARRGAGRGDRGHQAAGGGVQPDAVRPGVGDAVQPPPSARPSVGQPRHGRREVRRRLANQMPPAQMAAQAHRVIDTGGTMAETALKVLAAWVELGLPLPPPVIRPVTLADAEGTAAVLNSIVREGGRTIAGRTFTPAQERAFLRSMPSRLAAEHRAAGESRGRLSGIHALCHVHAHHGSCRQRGHLHRGHGARAGPGPCAQRGHVGRCARLGSASW